MKNRLEFTVDKYSQPITVHATTGMRVSKLIDLIGEKKLSFIPVLKKNKPVGIISEKNLSLMKTFLGEDNLTVKDIMTEKPYCVPVGTPVETVISIMSEKKISSIIITASNGEIDSIFNSTDILVILIKIVKGETAKPKINIH